MTSLDEKNITILKGYPEDKVWNVVVSFPELLEGMTEVETVPGPVERRIYSVQGWTDEPVDLNEVSLVEFNEDGGVYRLVTADDEDLPERVQMEMLDKARSIMQSCKETVVV